MKSINDNKEYVKQNRQNIILLVMVFIILPISVTSVIAVFLALIIEKTIDISFFIFTVIISIIASIIIYFCYKTEKNTHYFTFDINNKVNYKKICNKLRKSELYLDSYEDEYYSIFKYDFNSLIIRYMIVHMTEFNAKEYKKLRTSINAKYNRRHKVSNWVSHPGGSCRANVLVIDKWNEEIEKKLNEFANELYQRVEPIIFCVIFNNKMFVPPLVFGGPVNIYAKCNEVLYDILNN